jgi:hypothetical protein
MLKIQCPSAQFTNFFLNKKLYIVGINVKFEAMRNERGNTLPLM